MRENWDRFVQITKAKSESHMKAARYWDTLHTITNLFLIFLGAATTFFSLMTRIPTEVTSATAALTTLISAINAFIRPHDRRQLQMDSAKEFKLLMFKMIRCETEREYEDLWRELNSALFSEPFLPKKYVTSKTTEMDWSITPELQMVIVEKEKELLHVLEEKKNDENGNEIVKANEEDVTIHLQHPCLHKTEEKS